MGYLLCLIFMMVFGSVALVFAFSVITIAVSVGTFVLGILLMTVRLFFRCFCYSLKRLVKA